MATEALVQVRQVLDLVSEPTGYLQARLEAAFVKGG
jgi:hypothetical protein